METDEIFNFSAQSTEEENATTNGSNPSSNSKRARSKTVEEERSKHATASLKSTLLNMANPKCWKGFGAAKEKLKIEQGDCILTEGPEMSLSEG
ncbi:hypothetical protein ACOSQ3_015715 [Xanthoceras sorbifolium]